MNKVSNLLHVILEWIWLVAALASIFIGSKEAISQNWRHTLVFSGFALVSLYFFFSRRSNRLKK